MRFNLTLVSGPKSIQLAHAEVRDSLGWALTALGHEVVITHDWFSESGETNLIMGWELIADWQSIPKNSILYNLEQPSHPRFSWLISLLDRYPVWNSFRSNLPGAIHVPIGFTPNMVRFPRDCHGPEAWDAAFMGYLTMRRLKFLNSLPPTIRKFVAGTGCYGGVRDQILSRSKLALNIHHDGRDMFEVVRCSYLMANRVPVITEPSRDMVDYEDLGKGLTILPLDSFLESITTLKDNPVDLEEKGEAGFEAISSRNYVQSVERALDGVRTESEP